MGNKKDAGKGKRRGKGRVPDFANLEPRYLTDKQGSMYVASHAYGAKRHRYSHVSILTNKNQESPRMFFYTRGDRKVPYKNECCHFFIFRYFEMKFHQIMQ